jgi:hypothetical protein
MQSLRGRAFIKLGITIVSTKHKVYYAYLSKPNSADLLQDISILIYAVSILGNNTSLLSLNTLSV